MTDTLSIKARDLTKVYRRGSEQIRAVDGISLEITQGDFVSFIGPSGSGKTTLVNILGCLDNPTAGALELSGQMVFDQGKTLSEARLTKVRRELFGYVFQKFYLIPTLTVLENIVLPFTFFKKPGAEQGVDEILTMLGIDNRKHHLPGQISGGEMQRVAIARALVNKPRILLADEPTGNLDTRRSTEIGFLLKELNKWENLTVIMVTHNPDLARMANTVIELRDGKVHTGADACKPDEGCA